jgi:hypothetical protein
VAAKKKNGVMNLKEGKSVLTFDGYQKLAIKMMSIEPDGKKNSWQEGIFGWTYLVFCWNLMCRSTNVASVNFKHFAIKDDHFTIEFAQHKGDQCGEGLGNVKVSKC